MDIIKISVVGISGIILIAVLKQEKSEYVPIVSISVIVIIFSYVFIKLSDVVALVRTFENYMDIRYAGIILKMTGITYVAEFSSALCKDSGNNAIAQQIEVFAKISLLVISIPVLTALLETISNSI